MAALLQNFTQYAEGYLNVLMPDYMRRAAKIAGDPLLEHFAPGYVDSDEVLWDQWENIGGLIPLRGLGGKPDVVPMNGWKRYTAQPGYFGQTTLLEEGEITKGVQPGTIGDPMKVADRLSLFMMAFAKQTLDRWRKLIADMLCTGKIDLQDATGRRLQYQIDGYANQIKVPATAWLTSATTATPVQDLLNLQQQLQFGTDSRFGADSVLLANSKTIAQFFSIAQIIGTYKTDYGATVNGLEAFNKTIAGEAAKQGFTLPKIVRYDEGYYATQAAAKAQDKTQFNYFIPNQTFLWLGTRPAGDKPAQFQLTRHAGLATTSDARDYPEVDVDEQDAAEIGKGLYVRCHYQNRMPHQYELEAGFNGMPVVFFPSAFAALTYT